MRYVLPLALLLGSSAVAVAQENPTRSPEDYVCELTGECGETAETEAPQPGKPRINATRGFSLTRPAKPAATAPAPAPRSAASTVRPRSSSKPSVKTASVTRAKATAAKPGRVDLRLTFKLDSAELTPQAREEAKVFAKALQLPQLSARKFVIEGHTDAQGSRTYNLDLSQRRARAVAEYLGSLGVSSDRFEVKGYGFDRPLPGRSAASQDNRRVEAALIS